MFDKKKLIRGYLLGGISFVLLGLMEVFVESAEFGLMEAVFSVLFIISLLGSLFLLRQCRDYRNSVKKRGIYYVIFGIRFIGCVLCFFGLEPEQNVISGVAFILMGISCIAEAAYWKWAIKTGE